MILDEGATWAGQPHSFLGGLISDHQMSDFTWRLPFLIYFPSIEIFLLGLGKVMTLIDAVGYLASALVLLTFCMSTMLRLRAVAICSNLAFVGYGLGEEVYPVLILHLILLPLNVWLLVQMTLLLRKAKLAAATDLSPAWLQPFMRAKRFKAGEIIFRKGDFADSLYMIASGLVRLPEIDQRLSDGELFGEVGLFSVERRRTQTAVAATDVKLLWISGGQLKTLCERNPGLSLYFLRLTATRMTANASRTSQISLAPNHGVRP